jgi:TolA-binding protein
MTAYELAHNKWIKNNRVGPEPQFAQVQSLQSVNMATQILRSVVNQYPNHQRTQDALYHLGFLLTEMKSESAALYFQRLIDRFPKSNFIPDAHLALGEFHFSRNRFNEALANYQKVLSYRNSKAYPYAVYKLGWTFYNLRGTEEETTKNLQKSLTAFKLLVKYIDDMSSKSKMHELRKDALRDMVLVYADLGNTVDAEKYFRSAKEPELYVTLLERLAWLHADAGRNREAADIYGRLVAEYPRNPKNIHFVVRLAAIHEREQRRDQLIESLETASQLVQPNSEWMQAQKAAEVRESAKRVLVKELNYWSVYLHAEYQKTNNRKTAIDSLRIYNMALAQQAEGPEFYTALFNQSQLYTSLGEHDKAVEGYYRAATLDRKLSLRRVESKTALENAMAESEILLQEKGAPQKRGPEVQALEARLIKIIDLHAALFPQDPERTAHLQRAAYLVYHSGQTQQAAQRWIAMAKENPRSVQVSEGLRLIVKRSFDKADWISAGQETKQFLSIPGVAAAPVGAQLSKLQRVAHFQQALALEGGGKFLEAAKLFADFHKSYPTDPDAPKALLNSAGNQLRARQPEGALVTLEKFVVQYPQSEFKNKALEMTAATAEGLGRFTDAARSLEQLSALQTQKDLAAQGLHRAAEFRLAAGQPSLAITNIQSALVGFKRGQDLCEAYKTLIDAQGQIRSVSVGSTAKEAAQRCVTQAPEWGIYFLGLAAKLSFENNNSNEAASLATLALNTAKGLKGKLVNPYAHEGLLMAGTVRLDLLEIQGRALRMRRVSSSETLQVEFTRIKTDAQTLAQQYAQLAQLGQAEISVAALYRVAEIQETLASILIQVPSPKTAGGAELENFRSQLDKIAIPLQEQASQLYVQALEKSHDAEVISLYTRLLQEKLAVLRPGEYRKLIEEMPKPSYLSHELPMSKETRAVVQEEE